VVIKIDSPSYREIMPDGRLVINLHEGQKKTWLSEKRFVAMMAGTQGGKTCFGVDWLYREIKEGGAGDYIVVTATFPLLELKLLPEFRLVFETMMKLGTYAEAKKIFTYHDGKTRIIFGSATNPESIESATAKAAWLDEAGQKQFHRNTWEAIQRRLSLHRGRVLFTTTLYGMGWFKTEVYDRWEKGDTDYDVIRFDSTANPYFPMEEYKRAEKTLPRWKFNLFYRGIFDRPAGLIYDCFNDRTQVLRRFPIPNDWLHYVGHDFGANNPAALWVAQDPTTGYVYAYHEYLGGKGKSVGDHVREFKLMSSGKNIIKRVGGSHQEDEIRQAYAAHGWYILEPKIQPVEAGILKVYEMMKTNKLFIFDDLTSLIDEISTYSRKLDDNYNPTEDIEDKERYHLCDCTRYVMCDFTPEDANQDKPRVRFSF